MDGNSRPVWVKVDLLVGTLNHDAARQQHEIRGKPSIPESEEDWRVVAKVFAMAQGSATTSVLVMDTEAQQLGERGEAKISMPRDPGPRIDNKTTRQQPTTFISVCSGREVSC